MSLINLEKRIGYAFKDPHLLSCALTHKSAVLNANYERLEFLGDRVLGMFVADMLLVAFPQEPEGHLSRRFNALVRQETLAEIATGLDIGKVIMFGNSEEAEGGQNPAILADVCEALIAALYRDGGIAVAQRFVEEHWKPRLALDPTPPRDAKSALQEWSMAQSLGLPTYEEVARSGPDHSPVFTMRVSIKGQGFAEASGNAKRRAEQSAAQVLLEKVHNNAK